MKAQLIGYALLIGGPTVALINLLEWLRWRAGKAPLLGNFKSSPRSDMNKVIEGFELVGWTVVGMFAGFVGFGIVTSS